MKPNSNFFWALLAAALIGEITRPAPALAQTAKGAVGVTIHSDIPEITVRLEGAFTFVGKTPFTISQNMIGPYKLIATKRGYESKQLAVDFGRDSFRQITVGLQPLSPAKAALYSLLLPGTGQRYKGASTKGFLFTTLALGAGVRTFVTHDRYQDDRSTAERAEANYLKIGAANLAEKKLALETWQAARRDADQSLERRKRALILTGAVWTLNVLDALLMPPGPAHETRKEKIGVSLTNGTPELNLSILF